jgi:hypothetical protein
MEANTKAMQERMERQIGSLLSDRDELKQEIRDDREQMLGEMEAKTEATQERMDANLKDLKEDIKSGQAEMRSKTGAIEEKMESAIYSIRSERDETIQQQVENVVTRVIHETQNLQKACTDTTACHEATEADTEKSEPDPGMMQSVAEHQVTPKEDAVVKPYKGRKKRHRGRKPAAGRRGEPKEMTRGDCGSGRNLAAACRKVSSTCATVAWRKRKLLRKTGTRENYGPR